MFKISFFRYRSEETQLSEQPVDDTGLSRSGFGILLAFIFLIPFFFIPSELVAFAFAKSVFTGVVVIFVFALYLITVLKKGRFTHPRSYLFLTIPILLIVYFLAALFSEAPIDSLIGLGFEYSTFSFVLIMLVFLFLISQLFQSKERIFYAYLAFFASFLILAVFHLLRFTLGVDFLSFGYFTQTVSNTIGKWSDLGVFFGIIAVLALLTLEELRLQPMFRKVLYAVLAISLIFLAIVNIFLIWTVIAGITLLYLVYSFSAKFNTPSTLASSQPASVGEYGTEYQPDSYSTSSTDTSGTASDSESPIKVSATTIVVLVISVFFIFAGESLGPQVADYLDITNIDVRPGWTSTFAVSEGTINENPIFGAGPNRFVSQWYKYKPEGVNLFPYWNTDFNFGIGFIPSQITTTGILGFIAWILFLGSFIYLGIQTIFRR